MRTYFFGLLIFLLLGLPALAQDEIMTDDGTKEKTFTKLSEALENPEAVKRLDLAGQEVNLTDDILKRFKNLEFLSLKDDHLKEVPHGIVYLSKLKVLDLSGNDISTLPRFMKKLKNLEEVFLNDETNLSVSQSLSVLNRLPKLRSLHMENDGLVELPENLFKLKSLEQLYLNNNKIEELPRNIKLPEGLKLIDLQMNEIGKEIDKENRFGKGLIIRF